MHRARLTATLSLAAALCLVPLLAPTGVSPTALAAQAPEGPAAQFDAVYERFSAAYRQADPDAVAALYWPDAYYLSPNSEIAQGDVGSHFAWLADMEPGKGPRLSFEIIDRAVDGDLAYDIGIYTLRRDEHPDRQSRGKFIVVWKRGEDGTWKIHADGFSAIRQEE